MKGVAVSLVCLGVATSVAAPEVRGLAGLTVAVGLILFVIARVRESA